MLFMYPAYRIMYAFSFLCWSFEPDRVSSTNYRDVFSFSPSIKSIYIVFSVVKSLPNGLICPTKCHQTTSIPHRKKRQLSNDLQHFPKRSTMSCWNLTFNDIYFKMFVFRFNNLRNLKRKLRHNQNSCSQEGHQPPKKRYIVHVMKSFVNAFFP